MSTANITVVGRLSKDPESKTTTGGHALCNLSVPVETGFGDKKTTTWWNVTIWGKRGDSASQYLKKGSWVAISGEPSVRQYDKGDGSKGFSAEINASNWDFVGNKEGGQQGGGGNQGGGNRGGGGGYGGNQGGRSGGGYSGGQNPPPADDSEIPF
jgi:single-strand DNA-binding protein